MKNGFIKEFFEKKVIRNFGRENENFSPEKIVILKSWSAKNFPSPQTRRQVSAAAIGTHVGGYNSSEPSQIYL